MVDILLRLLISGIKIAGLATLVVTSQLQNKTSQYTRSSMKPYRIGVDVGGTNTDAAIIDTTATDTPSRGVCASSKTPTTPDVTTGIYTVIEKVLDETGINRGDVLSVAIGTTHFVNAVVQADARQLSRVAVVRLCGPFTRQVRSDIRVVFKHDVDYCRCLHGRSFHPS